MIGDKVVTMPSEGYSNILQFRTQTFIPDAPVFPFNIAWSEWQDVPAVEE